jgi:hypothetical protein
MTLQMKRYILGNGIWVDMNKKIISSIGALVFLVGSPMKASTPKPIRVSLHHSEFNS